MIEPELIAVAPPEAEMRFEDFFRAEYPRLARALYLLTGSAHEAEDVAQEAMARVYERWDGVKRMDSPSGYVYRAALNLHRSRLRKLVVRARRTLTPPGSRDAIETADDRDEILRLLAVLPDAQRQALVLVEWLGMSAEEAAGVLGIEPVSVRGRIHRARERVRREVEQRHE